jgi:hypothetical protein
MPMKKLRLSLDALEVSSFAAEGRTGTAATVVAMEATVLNTCQCTVQAGCYPSMYCTGTGCVQTADYTCMPASNSPC